MATNVVVTSALLLAVALGPAIAVAQGYPAKPVRVIVPFPPAGAADIVARVITQKLSEAWGTQVLVDNRAGAGGMIGAEFAMRAAPDGHTVLFASSSPMVISPNLATKPPYHPVRDFVPVILIGYSPNVLLVHPSIPAKTVKELIALARARPGQLNYASNGTGTLGHLTTEMFKLQAGIDIVHVPYKGGAPATLDTMAGQTSILVAAFPTVAPQMRAGRLRALAVTTKRRAQLAPELPTVAEAALPGFESTQWWGAYGPLGLRAEIVARLNADIGSILATPEMKQRLAADATEAGGGSPGDLAAYLKADFERWGKVVRDAKIRAE